MCICVFRWPAPRAVRSEWQLASGSAFVTDELLLRFYMSYVPVVHFDMCDVSDPLVAATRLLSAVAVRLRPPLLASLAHTLPPTRAFSLTSTVRRPSLAIANPS
jgi:hypothetical protein